MTTLTPSKDFGGSVSAAATTDSQELVNFTLTGPVADDLAFRVTGSFDGFRGNVRNRFDNKWINGNDTGSIRGRLRWTPTSNLTADLIASYTHSNGSQGMSAVPVLLDPSTLILRAVPASTAYSGITIDRNNNATYNDVTGIFKYTIKSASLKLAYDFGPATLLLITGFNDYKTRLLNDVDNTAFDFGGPATGGAVHGGISQDIFVDTKQLTQEVRLVSGPGRFRYVSGLWYARHTDDYSTVRGPNLGGPVLSRLFALYNYDDKSLQYAIFGQSDWDATDRLTVITGLRYSRERISYHYINPVRVLDLTDASSRGALTGRAGLRFAASEDANLFATYTRGYKGATYDLSSSFTAALAALGPVRPEHSNSYEIGVKTQFLDRRLTVNLSGFQTDYTDYQQQTIVPSLGSGFVLANVGSLRTRGIEVDGHARVSDAFSLDFAGAYLDAKIRSYPSAQCYIGQTVNQGCIGGVQDLSGKRLPNSPKWKGNISANYVAPITGTGIDAVLAAFANYQSKVNYGDPRNDQKGFVIVNLSVGVQESEDQRYKIAVFVNNVFNKQYYTGILGSNNYSAPGAQAYLPRDFRRYGGVRAAFKF